MLHLGKKKKKFNRKMESMEMEMMFCIAPHYIHFSAIGKAIVTQSK